MVAFSFAKRFMLYLYSYIYLTPVCMYIIPKVFEMLFVVLPITFRTSL